MRLGWLALTIACSSPTLLPSPTLPQARPTAKELLNHPLFEGLDIVGSMQKLSESIADFHVSFATSTGLVAPLVAPRYSRFLPGNQTVASGAHFSCASAQGSGGHRVSSPNEGGANQNTASMPRWDFENAEGQPAGAGLFIRKTPLAKNPPREKTLVA